MQLKGHESQLFCCLQTTKCVYGLISCSAVDMCHPQQISYCSLVHRIHSHHHQNVHDVMRVEIHVHCAWKPLLRNVHGTYCTTKCRHCILYETYQHLVLGSYSSWCIQVQGCSILLYVSSIYVVTSILKCGTQQQRKKTF